MRLSQARKIERQKDELGADSAELPASDWPETPYSSRPHGGGVPPTSGWTGVPYWALYLERAAVGLSQVSCFHGRDLAAGGCSLIASFTCSCELIVFRDSISSLVQPWCFRQNNVRNRTSTLRTIVPRMLLLLTTRIRSPSSSAPIVSSPWPSVTR